MELKDKDLDDRYWQDDHLQLTFPNCPECINLKNGKCRFSNKCTVRILHGERFGRPSHLNVVSVVDNDTFKYI